MTEKTNYADMSMAELRLACSIAADRKAEYDEIIKGVRAEITVRAKDQVETAYKEKGSDTGTARTVIDGIPLKLNRSKTVIWDKEKLFAAAKTIPAELAKKIFKLSIGIDEKAYNEIEDEDFKATIKEARTIKTGKASVDFEIKVT